VATRARISAPKWAKLIPSIRNVINPVTVLLTRIADAIT
jgi:hypothetical protein